MQDTSWPSVDVESVCLCVLALYQIVKIKRKNTHTRFSNLGSSHQMQICEVEITQFKKPSCDFSLQLRRPIENHDCVRQSVDNWSTTRQTVGHFFSPLFQNFGHNGITFQNFPHPIFLKKHQINRKSTKIHRITTFKVVLCAA